jgi:predicted molibdopterin-dependent oxidoreductase YjgC
VADVLGIDESTIPHEAGWPYHRILEGILRGEIRGLWIVATNPAHSWINQGMARDVLQRLDFLVVQDMYHTTETAGLAHLVLPAAGWGEKDGTFINSERRIGVVRKVSPAPGQALADFHVFKLVADYWGCGKIFRQWDSPESAFNLLKQLSVGQPCDFTGVENYEMLDQCGGIQWPFPDRAVSPKLPHPNFGETRLREHRLFENGKFFHSDGRARFVCESPRAFPEQPNSKYPFVLLTGRGSVAQWHTQTRTAKSAVLRKLYANELYVEINPHDSQRLGIRSGDRVEVTSQRGRLHGRAFVTPAVQPGQLFIPMHYDTTNLLTNAVFDPNSHQPAYKACAVMVKTLS